MELRKTPRMHDRARGLFEQSTQDHDDIMVRTIEFDTMVQNVQSVLSHDADKGIKLLRDLAEQRKAFIRTAHKTLESNTITNFTNIHRLATSVEFATERALLPYLFSSNTHDVQNIRRKFVNGIEGQYIEIINGILGALNILPHDEHPTTREYRQNMRGAIQEDTIAALLNHSQNGNFVVLPSSLQEDLLQGTDLIAYFIADDGHGYRQGISVKSTRRDAEHEKQKHPHLVVLDAERINNLDLSIAKLLVRRVSGFPGLTDNENSLLQNATHDIYHEYVDQLSQTSGQPLPQSNSQQVRRIHTFLAA
jgi:hypothetical protein